MATSPTTSAPRRRDAPRLPPPLRAPNACIGWARDAHSAGGTVTRIAVSADTPKAMPNTRASTASSRARGRMESPNIRLKMPGASTVANSRTSATPSAPSTAPTRPPTAVSTSPSASSSRTIRQRLAPIAARTAISR